MSAILIQKGDLASSSFSNDNTNNSGGVKVRVDAGSDVGNAIASAVSAAAAPNASETVVGVTRYATEAEHLAGTSNSTAATPAGVAAAISEAIDNLPTDKYVSGIQSYDPATNTITFLLSDGTTSTANASDLVQDAVDEALAEINVQLLANDGTTVLGYIKA